jgi:RimJ/RimL family protein N-acetyltransferase
MTVVLRPISAAAAEALRERRPPEDVRVAADYPAEFSHEVGEFVGRDDQVGPYFIHRADDDVVIGEIGGALLGDGVVEIGYGIVQSEHGRGHGTAAVLALVNRARQNAGIYRVRAHTPLDRPASARVLEKTGFTAVGDVPHDEFGTVRRWELEV